MAVRYAREQIGLILTEACRILSAFLLRLVRGRKPLLIVLAILLGTPFLWKSIGKPLHEKYPKTEPEVIVYQTLVSPRDDLAHSVLYLQRAAVSGNVAAQAALGDVYRGALGVPEDQELATHWYITAANSGSAPAMTKLCERYIRGRGVEVDLVESFKWMWIVAASTFSDVDDEVYSEGVITDEDSWFAAQFYWGLDTYRDNMTEEQRAEAKERARKWRPTQMTEKTY